MRILRRARRRARAESRQAVALDGALVVLGLLPGADETLIEIAYRCHVEQLSATAEAEPCAADRRRSLDEAVGALRAAMELQGHQSPRVAGWPHADAYELLHLHRSATQPLIATAYAHALRSALAAGDDAHVAALEWAYSRIGTPEARLLYSRRQAGWRTVRRRRSPAAYVADAGRGDARDAVRSRRPAAPDGGGRLHGFIRRRFRRSERPAIQPPDPGADAHAAGAVPIVARPVHALSITLGGQVLDRVELRDGAAYILGSAAHCDIPLVPPASGSAGTIAPEHARVAAGVGGVSFRQIAAQAQTLVNGRPARWLLLEPGDELSIGPYRCRYQIARFEADRWRVAAWS